jgi:esterase
MDLFFRKTGSGDPIIILHGLYGSSDNWHSIGRALAYDHEVFMIDLRNHGHSPHHPEHNYRVMGEDLADFFIAHHLEQAIFIGHSMGGKTALSFGLANPEKIKKMILVDISPFPYDMAVSSEAILHQRILQGLLAIQPDTISDRREADKILQKFISSLSIRQFLLKNLKRNRGGRFYWALNIPALAENIKGIFTGILREEEQNPLAIPFPLLFIKGENSGYINERDERDIRHFFPWSQIVTIQGAGHWVHAEQPESFLNVVRKFISE